VARVSTPRMLPAAALSGMRKALEVMKECIVTGEPADRPDLLASMEDITRPVRLRTQSPRWKASFTAEEDLDRKYRDDKRRLRRPRGGQPMTPRRYGPFKYRPIKGPPEARVGRTTPAWHSGSNPNVEFFALDDAMPGNNKRARRARSCACAERAELVGARLRQSASACGASWRR